MKEIAHYFRSLIEPDGRTPLRSVHHDARPLHRRHGQRRSRVAIRLLLTYFVFSTLSPQSSILAQTTDTAHAEHAGSREKGRVFYYIDKPDQTGLPAFDSVVVNNVNVQRYHPLYKNNLFYADKGNIGQIAQLIEYTKNEKIGYDYGVDPLKPYRFTVENMPFYQVAQPYTYLGYANGPKKEQVFEVGHYQNPLRGLNVGLYYRDISSPGRYVYSGTTHHTLQVSANYFSKDSRYKGLMAYYWNKMFVDENGGIKSDSLFTENLQSDRDLIPTNLINDSTKWREHTFYTKHSYRFASNVHSDWDFGYLMYTGKLSRKYKEYVSYTPENHFYPIVDTASRAIDSSFFYTIENTLAYSFGDLENMQDARWFKLMVGLNYNFNSVTTNFQQMSFYQSIPFVKAQIYPWKNHILLGGSFSVVKGTFNDGDVWTDAFLRMQLNPQDRFEFRIASGTQSASGFMHTYSSKHYIWQNDNFSKEQTLRAQATLNWKGFLLKGEWTMLSNYLYFNEHGPAQATDNFSVIKAELSKDLKLGMFGLDSRIIYQNVSSSDYMHLPQLLFRESIYIDFTLLRKNEIRFGFDVSYNTSYYADAYLPEWGAYYVQDQIKTGNYPYIDVFLNAKIRRANVFVEVKNLNAGWPGYTYIMTPHYPMNDRMFRWGVRWYFYD